MAASVIGNRTPACSRGINLRKTPKTREDEQDSPLLNLENDDEAEKRERQRIRLLELQQKAMQSPKNKSDRRSGILGLSHAQMAEHYSNCIKLSSENKITVKNAFSLHLIDYMQSMMAKKSSEMNNFQVASCTLDASAKIYASRVDFIHSETYKMFGGLNRTTEKMPNKKPTDKGDDPNDENENGPTPIKRRKIRRKSTIEQNLKNITLNKLDNEYFFDPLQRKMRMTFDEGGTSSLLLNSLSTKDDGCELQFDSKMSAFPTRENKMQNENDTLDMSQLSDVIAKIMDPSVQICPQFSSFSFLNWVPEDESEMTETGNVVGESEKENLAFNPDEVVHTEIESDSEVMDNDFQDGNAVDVDDDYGDEDSRDEAVPCIARSEKDRFNLITALSSEPSEYSYFNLSFFQGWAGPQHWHVLPLSKKTTTEKTTTRKNKVAFSIKFDETKDFEDEFKARKTNQLSQKTLSTVWSTNKTTLPQDLHYKPHSLKKLFLKPKVTVTHNKVSLEVDHAVNQYDYDNNNDNENFCHPPLPSNDGNTSDDLFSEGFEDTYPSGNSLHNDYGKDNLVQQPYKVAKIDIQYAKAAKKIDVKKVKQSMWKILTTGVTTKESGDSGKNKNNMKFTKMYTQLPNLVTGPTKDNLSIPIAFVCLLYLANEKELEICSTQNYDNLDIKW